MSYFICAIEEEMEKHPDEFIKYGISIDKFKEILFHYLITSRTEDEFEQAYKCLKAGLNTDQIEFMINCRFITYDQCDSLIEMFKSGASTAQVNEMYITYVRNNIDILIYSMEKSAYRNTPEYDNVVDNLYNKSLLNYHIKSTLGIK